MPSAGSPRTTSLSPQRSTSCRSSSRSRCRLPGGTLGALVVSSSRSCQAGGTRSRERLRQQLLLLELVGVVRAGRRACRGGTADAREGVASEEAFAPVGEQKPPGPHVLRLF